LGRVVGVIVGVILIVLLDQVSKFVVVSSFEPHASKPLIEGILHITYVQNTGAAFGVLANRTNLFIVIAIIIIAVMIGFFRYLPKNSWMLKIGLTLGIGGTMGNLIDRIRLGYVIDFIDFRVWPVFNIADSAIFLGVVALIFGIIRVGGVEEDSGSTEKALVDGSNETNGLNSGDDR
jgi:signal peptidase II